MVWIALILGALAGWAADRFASALTDSPQTARTQAAAAAAGALLGAVVAVRWTGPDRLAWAGVLWVLLALTDADLRGKLLPDALTLPLLAAGVAVSVARGALAASLLGLLAAGTVLAVLAVVSAALFRREAFGWGDVKLGAALGAWIGWPSIVGVVLLAFALGAVVGVAVFLIRAAQRTWVWGQVEIPFGPFLAAAAAVLIVGGWPAVAPATAQPPWVVVAPARCACSLQVPADWTHRQSSGAVALTAVAPPRADDVPPATIVVTRETLAEGAGVDQYAAAAQTLAARRLPGYRRLRTDAVTVSGRPPGKVHFYTWTPPRAAPLYQIQLLTVAARTGYAVLATVPATSPSLSADLALLMRILATFRVRP